MKFSTRQDIEAPADFVFAQLTDFEGLERQAMRRGMELKREIHSGPTEVGMSWRVKLPFRGKTRDIDATIATFDRPNQLDVNAKSSGLDMLVDIELVPLSAQRTRVSFGLDARPKSLSARILIQSVKFAKASLQRRFERRIGKFADIINERYEMQARG